MQDRAEVVRNISNSTKYNPTRPHFRPSYNGVCIGDSISSRKGFAHLAESAELAKLEFPELAAGVP